MGKYKRKTCIVWCEETNCKHNDDRLCTNGIIEVSFSGAHQGCIQFKQ